MYMPVHSSTMCARSSGACIITPQEHKTLDSSKATSICVFPYFRQSNSTYCIPVSNKTIDVSQVYIVHRAYFAQPADHFPELCGHFDITQLLHDEHQTGFLQPLQTSRSVLVHGELPGLAESHNPQSTFVTRDVLRLRLRFAAID